MSFLVIDTLLCRYTRCSTTALQGLPQFTDKETEAQKKEMWPQLHSPWEVKLEIKQVCLTPEPVLSPQHLTVSLLLNGPRKSVAVRGVVKM